MITTLLATLRSAVIPILKPTVLKAEKHSNAMANIPKCSSKVTNKKVEIPITISESEIMDVDRCKAAGSMRFHPTRILLKPRAIKKNMKTYF